MITDLILKEYRRNDMIKKIIIVLFLLIAIIILIFLVRRYKYNEECEEKEKEITINTDNTQINVKKRIIRTVSLLPNYTELGKEKMNNLYKSEDKTAYLTFDDGPSKTVTPLILDLLKQEQIKATFFVLGSRIEFYPDLVKREYKEGHFIANHGYSHVYKSIYSTPEAVLDEYNKTERLIQQAIGLQEYNSHLFRFPGGSYGGKYAQIKQEAIEILKQNNIEFINWNALTNDSAGANTKEELMANLMETVGDKTNVVILMHDAGDKILTYEILPDIINYLKEKGYTFKNFYSIMK